MSQTFWIIAGLAVFALVLLLLSGDGGTVFGVDNDLFAGASVTALWGAVIVSAVVHPGMDWGAAAIKLAVWALILATLMAGYAIYQSQTRQQPEFRTVPASEQRSV